MLFTLRPFNFFLRSRLSENFILSRFVLPTSWRKKRKELKKYKFLKIDPSEKIKFSDQENLFFSLKNCF